MPSPLTLPQTKNLIAQPTALRTWLAVGSLLLVAGSGRLWTPQHVFPRVPLFSWELAFPDRADLVLTWFCLVAWLVATFLLAWPNLAERAARYAALFYAVMFGLLVILDQHRLQPWGVHIAFCLLIATAFEGRRQLSWLIVFTASIYIYSALSKFDAQFLHTVGQDFLAGLLRIWPGGYAELSETSRFWLAACFPIGELICGLGLWWNATRSLALGLAIAMHTTLIAILGPWCLSHSWGVLLWNAVFIGMNGILWWQLKQDSRQTAFQFQWMPEVGSGDAKPKLRQFAVASVGILLMVLPIGERLGIVDHWPGWALYAPHSSRARIELLFSTADRQPAVVRQYVKSESEGLAPWEYIAIERWSLEQLGVPVYPQQRFYVGVARALAESTDEFAIQVTLLDTASRWSGVRKQRVLNSRSELERAGNDYWFNTKPRW